MAYKVKENNTIKYIIYLSNFPEHKTHRHLFSIFSN